MKRPQTSINTGLAAIFTLFYLQKSSCKQSILKFQEYFHIFVMYTVIFLTKFLSYSPEIPALSALP